MTSGLISVIESEIMNALKKAKEEQTNKNKNKNTHNTKCPIKDKNSFD